MLSFLFKFFLFFLLGTATGSDRHLAGKRFRRNHCRGIECPVFKCAADSILVVPDGECCPVCQPPTDCTKVECPDCAENEVSFFVDGKCCLECKPKMRLDCSAVRCAQPECPEGYEPVKKGCCDTCQLKHRCEIVECFTAPCSPICPVEAPKVCNMLCVQHLECESGYETNHARLRATVARFVYSWMPPWCRPA